MKRGFEDLQDISLLENMARFERGALLAKILYKLEKADLCLMYRVSKTIYDVCHRYQMLERLYTESVLMFGSGQDGMLGDNNINGHNVGIPRPIQGIPKVAILSCAAYHTGILTIDGKVYMFGNGVCGRLGDGNINYHNVGIPRKIQGIPKVFAISCAVNSNGIVTIDGDVYMFGSGAYGRLGDGDRTHHSVGIPRQIQNIPKVTTISCGTFHTGIVTVEGDVYMFGDGEYGKLGDGHITYHSVGIPRKIQGIPKVTAISCGAAHTGIITVEGDVYMFGNGEYGTLGDGDRSNHRVGIPRKIQNIPKIATVSCSVDSTGIVTIDGDLFMFGYGEGGRLGDGDTSEHDVGIPSHIQGIPKVAAISCGVYHTGIVTVEGDVYMFGSGQCGRLGDGNINYHNVGIPRKIQGIPKVTSISCSDSHTGILTVPESSLNLTSEFY